MRKEVKLYNVIFPIWFIILLPPILFIVIPANFIIDSLVLLIGIKCLKIKEKGIYKKSILKIWIFGFLADILGSIILFATQFLPAPLYDVTQATAWNPYKNIIATLLVMIVTLFVGFMIYLFNSKFSFNKTKLSLKNKKKLSIIIAVVTMPYMFLVPTEILYNLTNNKPSLEEGLIYNESKINGVIKNIVSTKDGITIELEKDDGVVYVNVIPDKTKMINVESIEDLAIGDSIEVISLSEITDSVIISNIPLEIVKK